MGLVSVFHSLEPFGNPLLIVGVLFVSISSTATVTIAKIPADPARQQSRLELNLAKFLRFALPTKRTPPAMLPNPASPALRIAYLQLADDAKRAVAGALLSVDSLCFHRLVHEAQLAKSGLTDEQISTRTRGSGEQLDDALLGTRGQGAMILTLACAHFLAVAHREWLREFASVLRVRADSSRQAEAIAALAPRHRGDREWLLLPALFVTDPAFCSNLVAPFAPPPRASAPPIVRAAPPVRSPPDRALAPPKTTVPPPTAPMPQPNMPQDQPILVPAPPEAQATVSTPQSTRSLGSALPASRFTDEEKDHRRIIARLLLSDRAALAAKYAESCASSLAVPPAPLLYILKLQCALRCADGPISDAIQTQLKEVLTTNSTDDSSHRLLWWSAILLPALISPSSQADGHLHAIEPPNGLTALRLLTDAARSLTQRVRSLSPSVLRGGQARVEYETRVRAVAADAADFVRTAPLRNFSFQPATALWQDFVKRREHHELALFLQREPSPAAVSQVRQIYEALAYETSFRRLVRKRDAERLGSGRPRPLIEGTALGQFVEATKPLLKIADEWFVLASKELKAPDYVTQRVDEFRRATTKGLPNVLAEIRGFGNSHREDSLAQAAAHVALETVGRLQKLLDRDQLWPEDEPEPTRFIAAEFAGVSALPLGDDGFPACTSDVLRSKLTAAVEKSENSVDAFRERLGRGDLLGAALLREHITATDPNAAGPLAEEFSQQSERLRAGVRDVLARTHRALGSARALGIFGDAEAAPHELSLVEQEQKLESTERLDLAHASALAVQQDINARRNTAAQVELIQLATQPIDPESRTRLTKLANEGDLLTFREYRTLLEMGQPLPTAEGTQLMRDFDRDRVAALDSSLAQPPGVQNLLMALRDGGRFGGIDFASKDTVTRKRIAAWLTDAWLRLKYSIQDTHSTEPALNALLAGLGFVVKEINIRPIGVERCIANVEVEPYASRDVCPVPRFGSSGKAQLRVVLLRGEQSADALLQAAGETAHDPRVVIVCCLGRVPPVQRAGLARLCRERWRSILLLDEALVAHLSGEPEPRLRAFFRAVIPWTFADPFVTSSSLVPPEMFYGRHKELAALQDSVVGCCFLFGGRQLGKTALLREAERRFHCPAEGRVASWIDLLGHGIGRESEPADVWPLLLHELRPDVPSLMEAARPDEITRALRAWLNDAPHRRILLLLDEADQFLERDELSDFAETRRLRGLMDATERRFKVVFAGLHNVLRTAERANHPFAQLGQPVNVGAFSESGEWAEAFALAEEPLRALGFRFESRDLVTRIISLTNFYPGLIQQFCALLTRQVLARSAGGPPYFVTADDIEGVWRDRELRKFIADRFGYTLQLDPRYRMLAYSLAHEFHESGGQAAGGTLTELRRLANSRNEYRFAPLRERQFETLLEEMCGLGVLRRRADRYELRNANLLLLLGDRQQIREVLEADVPDTPAYAPDTFHARWKNDPARRRPLAKSDEARLLKLAHFTAFVAGSDALGLSGVAPSLQIVFPPGRVRKIEPSGSARWDDFRRNLDSIRDETSSGIAVATIGPAVQWDVFWVNYAVEFCEKLRSEQRFVRVIFIAPAGRLWNESDARGWLDLPALRERLFLQKWSPGFIASWLDGIGLSPRSEVIDAVRRVTGGWPLLLAQFADKLRELNNPAAWQGVLAELETEQGQGDPRRATLLQKIVGTGVHADSAVSILRQLHALDTRQDAAINDEADDVALYADIIGVAPGQMAWTLKIADLLGLMDRVAVGELRWDPLVSRILPL